MLNNLSLTGWMDNVNPINGKNKIKTDGNRVSGMDATKLDLILEIPSTPSLRHGLKDWGISGSQVTPDTLR